MKKLIIYRSFFGTTRRYAELLREEIESDIEKYNKIDEASLLQYDMVILCTATYAGWISLMGYLQKHWHILDGTVVILVVIGSVPADAGWSIRSYNKIPEYIRSGIKYFKLPIEIRSKEANNLMKKHLSTVIEYIQGKTRVTHSQK